jgi:hypothetical protein
MHGLAGLLVAFRPLEAGGKDGSQPEQHPVCRPDHRILLVHHERQARETSGHQRRHRRIAAEADDDVGPDSPQQCARHLHAARYGPHEPQHGARRTPSQRRRRHLVHRIGRHALDQLPHARVGRNMHGPAARKERLAQC